MSDAKVTVEDIRVALEQAKGSVSGAAKILGVDRSGLKRRVRKLRLDGEVLAGSTVYPVMPDGQKLRGVSSLVRVKDPVTGEIVLQWVKTKEDPTQAQQETLAVLEALKSELPRVEPTPAPLLFQFEQLASQFTVTDYHLGMYSWGEETGEPWDMQIAEDLLVKWFERALALAPNAALGILAQLGDFLHYDSLEAVTPRSGHALDADSRAQKMIRVGIRVLRRVIRMMLEKYPQVVVIMAEGNHDIISSAWLREAFAVIFENEPRVQIITRPDPYYAIEWGQTGLMYHHGHLKKVEQLDKVFARKFREIFGRCQFIYGHTGHLHHKLEVESALMKIQQHPTLASADAYASRNGFLSTRSAEVITYHKQYGEVSRVAVTPEMVGA